MYDNIILYHVTLELHLCKCYQANPLEGISKDEGLHTDTSHDKNVWLNDDTNLYYSTFTTSASLHKLAGIVNVL